MSNKQLTKEEIISDTREILVSSYDLASGGIPPHTHMLEQIVEGKEMDDYARRTFLSLDDSNLLAKPGLTLYLDAENKEEAEAYFGRDMANNIYTQKKQLQQLAIQGTNAILRRHFYPESPWNFGPMSVEENSEILLKAAERGYLQEGPHKEWHMPTGEQGFSSVSDFVFAMFNAGGKWTEEGIEALEEADKLRYTEPLYSRAIELYAKKISLMNQLLRYAIGKANELDFADANVFNPAAYFGEQRSTTPASRWEESFQKYFGKSVPGAAGLLEWSEMVLTRLQEKYSTIGISLPSKI